MAVNINIPSQVRTFANLAAFPATGAVKTIYIAEDTNKTYRWTGTAYVEISGADFSGYVPTSRTLTINGTTQDLSANRTFTIPTDLTVGTTPIASGTIGRILFEGTGNVLQESANLTYSSASNIATIAGINLTTNVSGSFISVNEEISIQSTSLTRRIDLLQSSNVRLRVAGTTGNVLINTTTDAGFRLDVNGTARVRGASNLSTTTAFTIANSDSTTLLQVQDNGYIRIGSQGTSAFRVYATDASGDSEPSGLHLVLNSRVVSSATPAGIGMVMLNGINGTATTGTQNVFLISKGFAPTSGTATYSSSVIIPTINQTGGANGITRGLYINPTLTSAADFRAIETTAGRVVFGNLPTSSAGLPTGAIWNDGGTLKIV
jgi:hypothetical protein